LSKSIFYEEDFDFLFEIFETKCYKGKASILF